MTVDLNTSNPKRNILRVSYAQNGEDILLDRLFGDYVGRYMDIGSFHPILLSNTCFFHERGWRGVNIDPSPEGHALFLKHRPEDLNLQLAVSDQEGERTLYDVVTDQSISTLDRELAESYRARGIEIVERRIPVRTIRNLIDTYKIEPPDILSIDVEGCEAAVIRGIPLDSWRPRALVVEATLPGTSIPSHQEWEHLLLEQGYLFAAFNGLNRFFLREDLRSLLERLATPANVMDVFVPHKFVEQLRLNHDLEYKLDEADRERADWKARAAVLESAKAELESAKAQLESAKAQLESEKAELESEKAKLWNRCLELEQQNDYTQRQLGVTQRQLRPYQLLDRLGVVTAGYSWARTLRGRMVS